MTATQGHVLDVLPTLPQARCCVTSPPYWGLRDYGTPPVPWPEMTFSPMAGLPPLTIPAQMASLGLEPDPWAYIGHLVSVFRLVRERLTADGTLWLNLGDSFANSSTSRREFRPHLTGANDLNPDMRIPPPGGLKPKDLLGIPWRVAFALQADGWWLRSDVIWSKPNPMPESVTDRPTKAHEYVFLLAKSARYFFGQEAVREPHSREWWSESVGPEYMTATEGRNDGGKRKGHGDPTGRNIRSVWMIPTEPCPDAHFAVMPSKLAERCILAGSEVDDVVLDPFAGAGTTLATARRLGRRGVGCELNPAYIEIQERRFEKAGGYQEDLFR